MNRKIVALNVILAALLVWVGVQLRAKWLESKAREAAALARAAKPAVPVPPSPVPGVPAASAADYIDVAQKTLFSRDRDPNVIIDVTPEPPPPPPPPEPPVPPMPKYHGQMAFGEPVIVMSTDKSPQKSYKVGDKVGDFLLEAFDRESVTLGWNGKTFKNELKDLTPKEAERVVTAAAPTTKGGGGVQSFAKMGGTSAPANGGQNKTESAFGPANGIYRACVPSDTSPDGTTKDGYRKSIVRSLMGETCQWEPIR